MIINNNMSKEQQLNNTIAVQTADQKSNQSQYINKITIQNIGKQVQNNSKIVQIPINETSKDNSNQISNKNDDENANQFIDKEKNTVNKKMRQRKYYTDSSQPRINPRKNMYEQYKDEQKIPANNHFSHNDQFLNAYSLKQKDELIQKLTKKNILLKEQIYKVQYFQQRQLEIERKRSIQRKESSVKQLFFASSTKESLVQELTNAYFKIKMMEFQIAEIRKRQKANHDINKKIAGLKGRLQQLQQVRIQRSQKLQVLRRDNKKVQEKIEKYRKGEGFQEQISELTKQVDFLKDKQKELNIIQTKRKQKMAKQQDYIKKLQKTLIDNGVSRQFIQDLMNKIIYGDGHNQKQKQKKVKSEQVHQTRKQSQQKMEKQHVRNLHQIQILKKSIKQQQKTIQMIAKQQEQISQKYKRSITQSSQLENKILAIEEQIKQMRSQINPINLKPKPLPPKQPTMQQQKNQQKEHIKQVRKKFSQRKQKKYLQNLSLMGGEQQVNEFEQVVIKRQDQQEGLTDNNNQFMGQIQNKKQDEQQQVEDGVKNKNEPEINRFEQGINQELDLIQDGVYLFGQYDRNSKQFSDKQIAARLGLSNCKITGIKIEQNMGYIAGIQAIYNYKQYAKMHNMKGNQNPDALSEQFQCIQEQYITSISGNFARQATEQKNGPAGKLAMIDLTVLTNLNRYHKFGAEGNPQYQIQVKNEKKCIIQVQIPFEICNQANCFPVFILGSINSKGICRFGAKIGKDDQSNQQSDQQQEQEEGQSQQGEININ